MCVDTILHADDRNSCIYELCKLWFLARILSTVNWFAGISWNIAIGLAVREIRPSAESETITSLFLGGSVAKWFSDGAPDGFTSGSDTQPRAGFHNGKWLSRAVSQRETNRPIWYHRRWYGDLSGPIEPFALRPIQHSYIRNDSSSVSLSGFFLNGKFRGCTWRHIDVHPLVLSRAKAEKINDQNWRR